MNDQHLSNRACVIHLLLSKIFTMLSKRVAIICVLLYTFENSNSIFSKHVFSGLSYFTS